MNGDDRRFAFELMRDALLLLDAAGEQRATLHLQLALDVLDEERPSLQLRRSTTCH